MASVQTDVTLMDQNVGQLVMEGNMHLSDAIKH